MLYLERNLQLLWQFTDNTVVRQTWGEFSCLKSHAELVDSPMLNSLLLWYYTSVGCLGKVIYGSQRATVVSPLNAGWKRYMDLKAQRKVVYAFNFTQI